MIIAIHGGAGTILRSELSKEKEEAYHNALKAALDAGYNTLKKGQSALDAVEAAVISLEDCHLFNAGKGSVFNHEGKHEMDASLMYGKDLSAGAVGSVNNVKNPVKLARAIMEKSEHVLLMGGGAEDFAKLHGLEFADDDYFFDQYRYDQWQKIKNTGEVKLDHSTEKKFGTVGAVALDSRGHLAAATSTGGMTNKSFGRIGDTPLIGAGTYANDRTCAISCTGHGELFMRGVVSYDISCLMEYKGMSLKEACDLVVKKKLVKLGGEGGVIAIDKIGNVELCFNSEGMYRGWMKGEKEFETRIYEN